MMKKLLSIGGILFLMACLARSAAADVKINEAAPDFSFATTAHETGSLSDYAGKYVVLEWFNYDCPFVKKHYGTSNMQALQKELTAQGVVWLSINSSAPGKQGRYEAETMNAMARERGASPSAIILDPEGEIGRLYGAKTTPHMFLINPEGVLIYMGAIDSVASFDPEDVEGAVNYVKQAFTEAQAGNPVSVPSTQPYGCSVKY